MLRQYGSPLSEPELEELSRRLKEDLSAIRYAREDQAVPASLSS